MKNRVDLIISRCSEEAESEGKIRGELIILVAVFHSALGEFDYLGLRILFLPPEIVQCHVLELPGIHFLNRQQTRLEKLRRFENSQQSDREMHKNIHE